MHEPSKVFKLESVEGAPYEGGASWGEFIRIPAMSAGVYRIPAGATDLQKPHNEDEIYFVVSGRATFQAPTETKAVSSGDVIFVAAHAEHRFVEVTEDLALLVVFAPAETG